jgi:hypothetical protein
MLVHGPDAISAAGRQMFVQCHHRACPGDPRLTFRAGAKDMDGVAQASGSDAVLQTVTPGYDK